MAQGGKTSKGGGRSPRRRRPVLAQSYNGGVCKEPPRRRRSTNLLCSRALFSLLFSQQLLPPGQQKCFNFAHFVDRKYVGAAISRACCRATSPCGRKRAERSASPVLALRCSSAWRISSPKRSSTHLCRPCRTLTSPVILPFLSLCWCVWRLGFGIAGVVVACLLPFFWYLRENWVFVG